MAADNAPDFDQLERSLRALAYRSRLEILYALRFPRAVGDLRIAAQQVREGQNAHRVMSRQAVEQHLQRLQEIGAVQQQEGDGRGRTYVTNAQRLYQIIEAFREVSAVTATAPASYEATAALAEAQLPPRADGPHLVLVHGLYDGRIFPLRRRDLPDGRGWVVGRKRGLAVSLDYDPFVSLENSEIVPDGDRFVLLDLRSSRNGTWLNYRRLGTDERALLREGDILGFGRSQLVFRRS